MAHKKYDYVGTKKITSIRLSDAEKDLILIFHESVQEFIQESLKKLKKKLNNVKED